MKRVISILLILISLLSLFSCGGKDTGEITKLSFKSASTYEYLKTIDGKKVTINGYMATSSPVDGSFMFLMNLPYQSCPFCVPNTSQLSNTMEIYPKKNQRFDYTTQAIKVTGTLAVAPSKDQFFTDSYGYEFNFKIVDAEYTILSSEEMTEDVALWQRVASSDIISDIYKMYDYVNFLCAWNTYFVNSYTDQDGKEVKGYYLYASEALRFITKDGAQWNYGYVDGYFDGIRAKIRAIDESKLNDLIKNVDRAEALATKALKELQEGGYTSEYKYVEKFDTMDYIYTINKGEELLSEMDQIYMEFSNWLGAYEM